jgi:hypothetical protein
MRPGCARSQSSLPVADQAVAQSIHPFSPHQLCVRLTVHNGGRPANSKRAKVDRLTDQELTAMEALVQQHRRS